MFLRSFSFIFFFFLMIRRPPRSTLSLHDALPIFAGYAASWFARHATTVATSKRTQRRSEEHTSELQSQFHIVCRLMLAKKNETLGQPQGASGPRSGHGGQPFGEDA